MKLKRESKESLSIVTLDAYSEFEKLEPWVYKNPEFDEGTKELKLDKSTALFDIPEKIYGNTTKLAKIIMNDYDPKGETLGVLLVGKKGMGKSLLSENIAMRMIEKGYSVIHVTRPISARAVEKAVETLSPCMLYLEEFEKCFENPGEIPIFLNMFSATTIKGLLVVIAANNIQNMIYDPLVDRPQRLRYRINYSEIDDNVVEDILSDAEISKDQKRVYTEWVKSSKPNIDSLITLVKLSSHITDPNDLVEYISILNVPKLNPLRYKLVGLTLTSWNHLFVSDREYRIRMSSLTSPPTCVIAIEGDHKFKTEIDLSVENEKEPFFTVEKDLEVEVTERLLEGSARRSVKVSVELKFELTRDAGDIKKMVIATIPEEFEDNPLELIKDGEHVASNCRDASAWLAWE